MNAWRLTLASALRSLKLRITLGVVATLVAGIGLIAIVLVNRAEHDTLRAHHQRELSEAARTAALLSRNVIDLQRDLQAAAGRLDPAALADDDAVARFIESLPVLRARFATVFVASPDGRIRALAGSKGVHHPDINLRDRDYFRRTVGEGRPIVSEPVASRLSGEPVIILTYPVHGANGVAAVLCGTLRLASRDLIADLVSVQESDADALLVVTNARGLVLAHPDHRRVMQPLAEEPRLAVAFAAWVAQGSPLEPSGLGLEQPGEIVSAAVSVGPDWVVWRARPEAELLNPFRSARREAVGWAAGLIGLLSIAMFAFLWWLLRPMVLLERRAQHLFDGHFEDGAGWPKASGEIGRLGRVLRHVGAERAQLEAFNTQVLRKLSSVMSAAPIGIAFTRDQRFELVSAEFCRLLGREEHELVGQLTRFIYVSDDDYQELGALVRAAFQSGHAYSGEWPMTRADGSSFWASLRGNPVDPSDSSAGTIWTIGDVSDQKVEKEQLTWSATHDPLTGLANRKLFEQRAASVVAALPRSLPTAIVFIDLDRFKPINDSAGHAAGDAVLRAVAAALTSQVRASDLVVRLGGDEFALLLEHCGPESAMRIAESVRVAIDAIAVPWDGRLLSVGASLGIACVSEDETRVDEWLAAADAACYAAKAAGRGMVCTASDRAPAAECAGVTG